MSCSQFDLNMIQKYKDRIEKVNEAIMAITEGGVQEYSLNTGQSIQKVTMLDLDRLRDMADSDYAQLVILENRCGLRHDNGTLTTWY